MNMSMPRLFAIALGLVSHLPAGAQAPTTQSEGPGVDFSGVYAAASFINVVAVVEPDVYPFTAAAERAFSAYDPLAAAPNQTDDCTVETMPGIIWSNNPMQITQEEGRIVIRFERGNTTRLIPVADVSPPTDRLPTQLGYSVGHWVGTVLTIETTHMLDGVLRNNRGYPISREARITERYWREPGENNLQMEVLVDDPTNYTETFTLGREWIWSPDDEVRHWECINLGPRDAEPPDIDELARMLEGL
jgi:hypothetical protein